METSPRFGIPSPGVTQSVLPITRNCWMIAKASWRRVGRGQALPLDYVPTDYACNIRAIMVPSLWRQTDESDLNIIPGNREAKLRLAPSNPANRPKRWPWKCWIKNSRSPRRCRGIIPMRRGGRILRPGSRHTHGVRRRRSTIAASASMRAAVNEDSGRHQCFRANCTSGSSAYRGGGIGPHSPRRSRASVAHRAPSAG